MQIHVLLQDIPGSSGYICDDGPLLSQEHIQYGGLSRVGLSHDHGLHSLFHDTAVVRRVQKSLNFIQQFLNISLQSLSVPVYADMLRVIQGRLNEGSVIEDFAAYLLNLPLHASLQLTDRTLQSVVIPGLDHVDDRLRLGEIQLAVQEGSLCKFTRLGRPGPSPQTRLQHSSEDVDSAVTVDLHCVLAGKGMRPSHEHDKDFVYGLPVFLYIPVVDRVGFLL